MIAGIEGTGLTVRLGKGSDKFSGQTGGNNFTGDVLVDGGEGDDEIAVLHAVEGMNLYYGGNGDDEIRGSDTIFSSLLIAGQGGKDTITLPDIISRS